MAKQITVIFHKDGKVTMEGHEFKGVQCDEAMRHLEEALGEEQSRENKAEYGKAEQRNTQYQ